MSPPARPIPPRLTTPGQLASAFRSLRWRLASNGLRSLVNGSRLRLSMIVICSAIFWSGLFFLFFGGFQFLKSFIPNLAGEFVEYIFSLFFLSLLGMLIFSTGIILYTGLYGSKEAAYLLTTPASPDRIFAYKFFEAMAYSSWAFLLLGSPLMVSFGIVEDAGWTFYAIFPVFFLGFVLIPGSLGAIGAMVVATIFPRRQKTVFALLGGGLLLALIVFGLRVWRVPGELLTVDWLDAMLGRIEFSRHPLWPSRWISVGLVALVRGEWTTGLFYLSVVLAHAGLAYLIAAVVARDLYRIGYGRVQGGRSSRKRIGWYGLDSAFHRVFFFLPNPIRLLILKDLRTFRRDPAQWSQFLIFFGLLAFYFVNIRRLSYDVQKPYWRNPDQLPQPVGDGTHPLDLHQPVHLPLALARRAELLGPRPLAAQARVDPLGLSSHSRPGSRWWRPRSSSSSPTSCSGWGRR